MFWKIEALTAKRSEITQIFEGSLVDAKHQALLYGLEILNISPDYIGFVKSLFKTNRLSASELASFFNDFSDMQKCGLTVNEAIDALIETNSNIVLKEALRKISNFVNDGRTLEEAFINTGIFSKIVPVTISAAEKTGNIPELFDLLAQFYRFKNENRKKIFKSLVYPGAVFCMLTGLSIFISMNLVPQLKSFLPTSVHQNLSAIILIGYSSFIKQYWWSIILILMILMFFIKYLWDNSKEKLMKAVFCIPLLGEVMKNIELSHIFLNLFIYQKSGVNIIQTITSIHQANGTYITEKLILIRDRIYKGASLGEAFKEDRFFPSFVYQNLTKGQVNGYLPQYFERIYKYYDIKSKESISVMIALIEPLLLVMTALFLLSIICAFILPIYTNINQLGAGVFQ